MVGPPSKPQQSAVALAMTDEDVVRQAALLLEATYFLIDPRDPANKPVFTLRVRGHRAIEVMEALYPHMGVRRRRQIDAAVNSRSLSARRVPYATEIVAMINRKWAGDHRSELAAEYGVTAKAVDKLVRGAERPLAEIIRTVQLVQRAEAVIAGASDGDVSKAWFIGLMEGEGGFDANGLRLEMTDRDVVEHCAYLLGSQVRPVESRRSGWSPTWCTGIGRSEALALIGPMASAYGSRRQRQIEAWRKPVVVRDRVPAARLARNREIARRLAEGESGPALASEYGMTHQNVYYIGKRYKDMAACPRG